MAKRILLGGGEPFAQLGVEIKHLVRRFIDDLLREQVFDRRRKVVDFEPLTPTAVDVVKHPLERPQAREQPMSRVVTEAGATDIPDYLLDECRAAFAPALLSELSREILPWQVGHGGSVPSTSSFPRKRESSPARLCLLPWTPASALGHAHIPTPLTPSCPRKWVSGAACRAFTRGPWVPAFAGTTGKLLKQI